MDNKVYNDWKNTTTALNEIESLMACCLCLKLVEQPIVLGGCEHFFCKNCVESYLVGEECPKCKMPSHARDLMSNKQLGTAVLIIKQLKNLLVGNESTQIEAATSSAKSDGPAKLRAVKAKRSYQCQRQNSDKPATTKQSPCRTPVKSKFKSKRRLLQTHAEMYNDSPKTSTTGPSSAVRNSSALIMNVKRRNRTKTGGLLKSPLRPKAKTGDLMKSPLRPKAKTGCQKAVRRKTCLSSPSSSAKSVVLSGCVNSSDAVHSLMNASVASSTANLSTSTVAAATARKNAKGETPLHRACIKGDLESVQQLLADDVSVNVKDNAGWTPLHEAVNHGHVVIAELLLNNGAFVNIPGLDNDTPLHDAVQSGNLQCVRLLVQKGASKHARNIHGKTPLDLATTSELRDALDVAADASCTVVSSQGSYPAYNQVVIMSTGLSREQKSRVSKCAALLHGRVVHEFSHQVTHVVTSVNGEGQCPRTIKYLQAVLTGKWILTIQWVETCLEYDKHVPEEAFEIAGSNAAPNSHAPQMSRVNYQQQLPPLFDGCQFYFHGDTQYPLPAKSDLIELVRLGGGTVLQREPKPEHVVDPRMRTVPYHAQPGSELENCGFFVIYDDKSPDRRNSIQRGSGGVVCCTKASWLVDCIALFTLRNIDAV